MSFLGKNFALVAKEHTEHELQRRPVAMRSTLASFSRYFVKLGSTILIRGSGYRWLGSHSALRRDVKASADNALLARNALRCMFLFLRIRQFEVTGKVYVVPL